MWNIMLEGGYPMWFLLIFGLAANVAAIQYAARPTAAGLHRVIGLGTTTLFSILTGMAADMAAVGHKAPDYWRAHPDQGLLEVVLRGVGESMSPAILGFNLLTVMALIVSFGLYRRTSDR